MSKKTSFNLCPEDWLSNHNISAMTSEEEGAYIRLLCCIWVDEDCSVRDNDALLLRLSKLSKDSSHESLVLIKNCLMQHPSKVGFLTNKDLLMQRKKQNSSRENYAQAGRRSGVSRAANKPSTNLEQTFNQPSTNVHSPRLPRAVAGAISYSQDLDNNTPHEIHDIENAIEEKIRKDKIRKDKIKDKIKEKEKINQKEKEKFTGLLEDQTLDSLIERGWSDEEIQCWVDFIQDRKERKSPMTALAKKKAINILQKYKTEGMDILEILNTSIVNGWKGLFPVKNYSQGRSYGSSKDFGESSYRPGSAARLAEDTDAYFARRLGEEGVTDFDCIDAVVPDAQAAIPE